MAVTTAVWVRNRFLMMSSSCQGRTRSLSEIGGRGRVKLPSCTRLLQRSRFLHGTTLESVRRDRFKSRIGSLQCGRLAGTSMTHVVRAPRPA